MRLSEINWKSIVEVSLMNGLYIYNYVRTLWLEVCWIDGESLANALLAKWEAKQFSTLLADEVIFAS